MHQNGAHQGQRGRMPGCLEASKERTRFRAHHPSTRGSKDAMLSLYYGTLGEPRPLLGLWHAHQTDQAIRPTNRSAQGSSTSGAAPVAVSVAAPGTLLCLRSA